MSGNQFVQTNNGLTKLKSAIQLQDLLDATRALVPRSRHGRESDSEAEGVEHAEKLRQVKAVLEEGGHFSGIYRKVQLKPLKWETVPRTNGEGEQERHVEALMVLKYGGVLTHAGRKQAEELGRFFRNHMYPGLCQVSQVMDVFAVKVGLLSSKCNLEVYMMCQLKMYFLLEKDKNRERRVIEAMELVVEDSDSEEERVDKRKEKKTLSMHFKKRKEELNMLLSRPLQPKSFSHRFLAGGVNMAKCIIEGLKSKFRCARRFV